MTIEPLQSSCHRGSLRDVLRVAWPLILASSGHALRLFADRVMLSRHSETAIKASLQAGITSFTLMCFFLGICFYTATFVSQYTGSKQPHRVGPSVWTGMHFALVGGVLLPILLPFSGAIIGLFGHSGDLLAAELSYFRILLCGSIFGLLNGAMTGFWSGRGKTRVVMIVELGMTAVNILLNYILIFGEIPYGIGEVGGQLTVLHTASPLGEMGIAGAAWGTVIASALGTVIFLALLLRKSHRETFATHRFRPSRHLLSRLWKFGSPSGTRFFLEVLGFNIFVYYIGTLGSLEHEASNIALSINALAFLPLVGLGQAGSVLVGQAIGAVNIPAARRAVKNTIRLAVGYALLMAALFVIAPDALLQRFQRSGDPLQGQTFAIAKLLMLYLAAYLSFDAIAITVSHALGGAGDTKWTMYMSIALEWCFFVVPVALAHHFGMGLHSFWAIFVAYVAIYAIVFAIRYHRGAWESMRVIEPAPLIPEPRDFET
ncbi:MAG: MATE family efflux transporter, partial [Phycisphaerales bacterium]|nr:MATE family efflux transporter [Phycisphaerales bacterium]MBT7170760.1 MATE family efflux transporter [Phycisphaerales bacterium]